MNRKEKSLMITSIADRLSLSVDDVSRVIREYDSAIAANLCSTTHPDVSYGIVGFEDFPLCPGITLIYGWESTGKSSLAKRIARGLHEQGSEVLFVEADSKRTNSDAVNMSGVFHTEDTEGKSIHRFLSYHLIDVVIIDSLTALTPSTQKYLMHHARRVTPYVIATTQMRYNSSKEKIIPAVSDTLQAMASTHIYLKDPLPVNFDGLTSVRTTARFIKHPDHRIQDQERELTIVNNMVHNSLTAYSKLYSGGRISSMGAVKYVDSHCIGTISSLIETEDSQNRLMGIVGDHGEGIQPFYSSDPLYKMPDQGLFRGANFATSVRL